MDLIKDKVWNKILPYKSFRQPQFLFFYLGISKDNIKLRAFRTGKCLIISKHLFLTFFQSELHSSKTPVPKFLPCLIQIIIISNNSDTNKTNSVKRLIRSVMLDSPGQPGRKYFKIHINI